MKNKPNSTTPPDVWTPRDVALVAVLALILLAGAWLSHVFGAAS